MNLQDSGYLESAIEAGQDIADAVDTLVDLVRRQLEASQEQTLAINRLTVALGPLVHDTSAQRDDAHEAITAARAETDAAQQLVDERRLGEARRAAARADATVEAEVVEARGDNDERKITASMRVVAGKRVGEIVEQTYHLDVSSETALATFFRQMKSFGLDENYFAEFGNRPFAELAVELVGKKRTIYLR